MTSAVVFAYHTVGVRCLRVLLASGVDVRLVVTHQDNPNETIWFESVQSVCADHRLACITPDNPNTPEVIAAVKAAQPDFMFSFYYRQMLGADLLSVAPRGAYNMHGSLLPKYRGRVPVNWAIIHGETRTGATLHQMNIKPDNGPIVDQEAVPILPDDSAEVVFGRVVQAAETCLLRAWPALRDGSAVLKQQDLSQGAYFGGRTAADGRIRWDQSAVQIHNLIRAVTRPYPGAFDELQGQRLRVWRSRVLTDTAHCGHAKPGQLFWLEDRICYASPAGGIIEFLEADIDGTAPRANSALPQPDMHKRADAG